MTAIQTPYSAPRRSDQPAPNQPMFDQPMYNQQAFDQPMFSQPAFDQQAVDQSVSNQRSGYGTTTSYGTVASRFWVGAGISAAITALVGVIGLVVAHGIVHVPVVFESSGQFNVIGATSYALVSAAAAFLGAALYFAMLKVAPHPRAYYTWLASALTALAVLVPFTSTAAMNSKIALAAMNLAVGLLVMLLIPLTHELADSHS